MLGVIDALRSGFELVFQHPFILLIPILIDLFLWFGPQISIKPLFQQTFQLFASTIPPDAPSDLVQNIQATQTMMQTVSNTFNLFAVIAIGAPSVMSLQPPLVESLPAAWLVIQDGRVFVALVFILLLLAGLVASVYYETIARGVRHDGGGLLGFAWHVVVEYITLIGLICLLFVIAIGLLVPLTLVTLFVSLLSQEFAALVFAVGMLLLLCLTLYLTFAIPAIFISGSNPFRALLNSIMIFRFDLWSTVGLILLMYIIQQGFMRVWMAFSGNAWLVFFAVLGNAFLGSALWAASMLFYNDRMQWLTAVREYLKRQTQLKK